MGGNVYNQGSFMEAYDPRQNTWEPVSVEESDWAGLDRNVNYSNAVTITI